MAAYLAQVEPGFHGCTKETTGRGPGPAIHPGRSKSSGLLKVYPVRPRLQAPDTTPISAS